MTSLLNKIKAHVDESSDCQEKAFKTAFDIVEEHIRDHTVFADGNMYVPLSDLSYDAYDRVPRIHTDSEVADLITTVSQ